MKDIYCVLCGNNIDLSSLELIMVKDFYCSNTVVSKTIRKTLCVECTNNYLELKKESNNNNNNN